MVKLVTGIRRCGKSSLLDLFHKYLSDNGVADTNIIHMNLESLHYRNLSNYLAFYDYVSERIPKDGKTYLIFDELQAVAQWEKAIESFRLDFDVDIYITGSNAYLLSTEFSTLLSGRYVEIRMFPLSFKEFLDFYEFGTSITIEENFQRYLQFGGIPIPKEYQFNEARINQALEGIYSTVVLRDILPAKGKNVAGETGIDFVAEKPNDKLYIQVTESMQSPETRERELRPLRLIPDNYEKIILSMDRNYINSYDGIKSLYLIDWLLS